MILLIRFGNSTATLDAFPWPCTTTPCKQKIFSVTGRLITTYNDKDIVEQFKAIYGNLICELRFNMLDIGAEN